MPSPETSAKAAVADSSPSETGGACAAPDPAQDLATLWASARELLKNEIPEEQFETWFRRANLIALDEEEACVAVQNGFTRDWLVRYYQGVLSRSIGAVLGGERKLVLMVDPELALPSPPRKQAPGPARSVSAPTGEDVASDGGAIEARGRRGGLLEASDITLNPHYRFDNFVVGPCNRFAHAAALGVSEAPGRTYNPFFLHGSVGLGKTHLLQSLCRSALENDPETSILYLSCETFVNHFISALENGDLGKFRTKYRNVDILVVDDIHLLANKERTQEEFFHTFNTLYNAGKQIVLSSDSPPKDIPTLQGRLVSRFKMGLVTETEAPSYETRVAILKRKSKERGREIPDEVASLLAESIDTNIRELEGAVTKVLGFAALNRMPITTDLVRQCLREVFTRRERQVSTEDILRVVTDYFGVKLADLQSRRRTNAIAFPRQVGMYVTRKHTKLSLEEIGGFYGGRDHSTVLYGTQKITRLVESDPTCRHHLLEIEARLRGLRA